MKFRFFHLPFFILLFSILNLSALLHAGLHFSKGKALIKKELEAAKDDLNEAKNRLKNKKYKIILFPSINRENSVS